MKTLHITSSSEAVECLKKIGVDPYGIEAMVPKMENLDIFLEGIECRVANILKQEMLSLGGDVAVARGSVGCSIDKTDAVIIGTKKQIRKLSDKLSIQPFGLKRISQNIKELLINIGRESFLLKMPEREIKVGQRTLIMGILNMTPDSFSDGGMFTCFEEAVDYALRLEADGADILDVGGESTRPGSESVSVEEELKRVLPLVKEIKKRISIPISLDTTKAEVAQRAIDEGVEIINDISAMRFDERMPGVVARYKVPVVLMHMQGTPKTMQKGVLSYDSLQYDIIQFLRKRIEEVCQSGIAPENIIIDPGVGFGKSREDNFRLLKYLKEFKTLGRPILVGTSRKSFIRKLTGEDASSLAAGTAATVTAAIMNGAHIVRVHDVGLMKKAATVADAIVRG